MKDRVNEGRPYVSACPRLRLPLQRGHRHLILSIHVRFVRVELRGDGRRRAAGTGLGLRPLARGEQAELRFAHSAPPHAVEEREEEGVFLAECLLELDHVLCGGGGEGWVERERRRRKAGAAASAMSWR